MKTRISKDEYALKLAETAALRSEDPFYQVGASAMTSDGRVIATGYNGILPGMGKSDEWWHDKEKRKPFMIHAEQNLCSLIKRGEASLVAVTLMPCPDCFRLLAAHGVKRVVYRTRHENSLLSDELSVFFNIGLLHAPENGEMRTSYDYLSSKTP